MFSFILRRVLSTLAVLVVASYLVYVLAAVSSDPLSDLRQSNLPNRDALIKQRIDLLQLDVPPYLRYFLWAGGVLSFVIGRFSLGTSLTGQPVTDAIGSAMGSTLQLVTVSLLVGIVIGVALGITTALRLYSAYDYTTTFMAFLFFSLPVFWIAVMLKQFGAIGFNNFLAHPVIDPLWIAILALLAGVIWMGIIGGATWRRRLLIFGIAAVATAAVLTFISATGWFSNPGFGIVVCAGLAAGIAVVITILSTGWANRRARWTSLTVAGGIAVVLYYPLQAFFSLYGTLGAFTPIIPLVVLTVLGGVAGWAWGGNDRRPQVRTGAIVGFLVTIVLLIDRYLQSWAIYSTDVTQGRPISTVGAGTPDLEASVWVTGLDNFSHLLLPTLTLILASLAGYSRYSRSSLLDVLNQDYIRTARAKGLTERTVVMRHAFRNALIPITTVVALDFGALIGGAVLTETVFAWSGMGALFVQALRQVDLNSIMGFFLVTAVAAVFFNFVADMIYTALDPRIRVTS